MCCTGLAPRQAQHTLLGNNCMAIVYLLALQLLLLLDAAHCRHAACVLSVFPFWWCSKQKQWGAHALAWRSLCN